MDIQNAIIMFDALSQETRLNVFRALIRAGAPRVSEIRSRWSDVHLVVNCLRNDARGALSVAVAGDADAIVPLIYEELRALAEALCGLVGRIVVDARDPVSKEEPLAYALVSGATVLDLAGQIHKDLARSAQKARVWGPSASFDGQEVGLDHVLSLGDTVEILTR